MIKAINLRKTYGDFIAVENMNFSIKEGQILGLIGQNGSGKTTTFRMILDFIKKDQGKFLINGENYSEKHFDLIGYLPEERGLDVKRTIEEPLYYFAALRGKSKQEISPKIDEYMTKFAVKGNRKDKIKKLSKGNQQKVQLIATLIHQPKFIILDEPFSGLDPVNVGLLKDGINELKKLGSTVIFSSHNMENVEQIVDYLIMINNGKVVLDGTLSEIKEQFGRKHLTLHSSLTKAEVKEIPGVLKVIENQKNLEITLETEEVGKVIFEKATKNGYIPVFNQQYPSLEEIFKIKVQQAGGPNE